ncbi:MAG: glycosyltransferase [Aggregatilineales bacterium]
MAKPVISIVTGTYNRLPLLRQMIESVRQTLPQRNLAYEFVVVDGGSTDATIEYARSQSDITLIEQGELRGAIAAFCEGAMQAQGDYVVLANDDVQFLPGAILRAFTYLESVPTCGAVAFADDRPAPGYGHGFKVQSMQARTPAGNPTAVPYAQVGMFRRWLGDLCGWWGADDDAFNGYTYGGDNYLSSRIYEYGYTVDAVAGVRVRDIMAQDGLRRHNVTQEADKVSPYHQRFPHGAQLREGQAVSNLQREQLRILYLPIFETRSFPHHRANKRGLMDALAQVGHVLEVDYLHEPVDLCSLTRDFQPHILFTQCQGERIDLAPLKAEQPNMLIINWNGDVHESALTSVEMLDWLQGVDLQLCVNESVLPVYDKHHIPARYWQVAYEPVPDNLPDMPAFDVVFMGNAYSEDRKQLERVLRSIDVSTGIYGSGWQTTQDSTMYDFARTAALSRNAKIVIGDNQYTDREGFVSNRLFEVLAHGGFLLHQTIPGLERLTGLKDGVHYAAWSDFDDLREKIAYWLDAAQDKRRAQIARNGKRAVRKHHSFEVRVKQLFHEILPGVVSV